MTLCDATAQVLFPWRRGDPWRDRAAIWVMTGWRELLPEYPILSSLDLLGRDDDPGRLDVDGQWCKARHVDELARAAAADILIISDVDVWTAPSAIREAVAAVASPALRAKWAVPHETLYRLTGETTERVLAGSWPTGRISAPKQDLSERHYTGHAGGGITVIGRELLHGVPLDPRFVGWGPEDGSWAGALGALVGKPYRGHAGLLHLWHLPAPRPNRHGGDPASVWMTETYSTAVARARHGSSQQLRTLLAEARAILDRS